MTRAARLSAAILAFALLGGGALVALPASAATGDLFTLTDIDDVDAFSTISKTDATEARLEAALPETAYVAAIEIYQGVGYAVGWVAGPDDSESPALFTWDILTGAITATVALPTEIEDFNGFDTSVGGELPDGTLLAIVGIGDTDLIVSIDPATGAITQLVDVTDRIASEYVESLATDPTTGITYVMTDNNDGQPNVLVLDLVARTYEGPIALTGISSSLGDGYVMGSDFDAAGTLWFFYNEPGLSSTVGEFGPTVEAVTSGEPNLDTNPTALAVQDVDVAPAPQLAATGVDLSGPVALVLALMTVGGLALLARRRAAQA